MPGLLLTVPYTAVQFVALQQCREFAARHGLMTGKASRPAVAGCCSALSWSLPGSSTPFLVLLYARPQPAKHACRTNRWAWCHNAATKLPALGVVAAARVSRRICT